METWKLALIAALAIPAALLVAVFVYVAGSFVLMRRHTAPRSLGLTAGDLVREFVAALRTQPFLLWFYLAGRRLGGSARGGVPVVFVHGYMQNRVDFWPVARSFAPLGPLFGFNYPWFLRVDDNARRLSRFIDGVLAETGASEVDLVCHSLGGLVAMELLRQGETRVRRCVTFASPHAGVAWRGPILGLCASQLRRGSAFLEALAAVRHDVPLLSVYSTHDNVVHPPETSSLAARGGRDHVLPRGSHLAVLYDPSAVAAAVRFLEAS